MSYTDELTQEIIREYEANPTRETIEQISTRIGKSTRSIIAKLAAEKIYRTPIRTTKTGEQIVKKEELVADIERWLSITAPTLVKTSKQELKRLHAILQETYGTDDSQESPLDI